ncbi:MAG: hypothetical protein SAK29_04565 [Scytonema sp. PMC 1069.18]|nr:hypothetical protein [Scytonema sp. PMC 1069.18]MEC4885425.1 hypothetical protein [Scytonema sp. PMC 1070.18]
MISGRFGDNKELFFEIQLVTANGEEFLVEALFDTGFTDGWLAIYMSCESCGLSRNRNPIFQSNRVS